MSASNVRADLQLRAQELCSEHLDGIRRRTDQLFAGLMIAQWLACVAISLWWSPRAWAGSQYSVHFHVYAAVCVGGLLTLPTVLLARLQPGRASTRHTIAFCQISTSALLIHLTGGRIETHFHVFGSLAFLSFYRDWTVLLTAAGVAALDHFVRSMYWPESVFGLLSTGNWRWLEHAGWVLFEDLFLILACRRGVSEAREIARHRAQMELTQADIETTVRERTAELATARDQALEAVRAKTQFLANMSHEIRTPMNGILGFVELMLDTPLNEQQQSYLRTVHASGETLLTIINDILDLSKIEAGKLDLELIEFDLRELVEQVGDFMTRQADVKQVEFVCVTSNAGEQRLLGDPTRIRQVLLNLVGNAIKFTERGEIVLRAEVEARADGRVDVRLSVRDTGVGISPEAQAQLFQPFTQADGSTTRRFGGTGLGLAISRRLVELMGGAIELESALGLGSTFTVRLQLGVGKASGGLDARASLKGLRVLAVDDNSTNRQLLRELLVPLGCRLELAAEAGEALGILRTQRASGERFDIVLLDFQMPGMDGLDLARHIRALPECAALPLVLLSSVSSLRIAEQRSDAVSDILCKPVKRGALIHTLARLSGRQPAPADAPGAPGAALAANGAAAAPAAALPATAAARAPCVRRVLVVEDNLVNQRLAVRILERAGHTVRVAHDGAEAVELSAQHVFDVILMDVQMPIMDGLQAAAQIRARQGAAGRVPILALTANAMETDRQRCAEAGMDDFLAKPLKAQVLCDAIERWGARADSSAAT